MKCPECHCMMKRVKVKVQDAKSRINSFQCPKCSNFEFEKKSAKKVIRELKGGRR